jgi:Cadherin-like domain
MPVAVNDLASTLEDIPVTISILGNDTDVDAPHAALTIASVTSGVGGIAVLNPDGTVTYTPKLNFNGTANFTYTITDGLLSSNTATVTISVASVIDIETVTLSTTAPATVVEGSIITYTATVASPVTGTPLVLTLSSGQTSTVGATTGTVDFATP